jgi:HAD superfamily hydrolase (TIGR01549 family)
MDRIVIFDVDGTLMDTNYQHALAWFRALRGNDVTVPIWQLHRAIGMGGDRLVEHVAGAEVERSAGDAIRDAWKTEYEKMIDEVLPFEGATELLRATHERGYRVSLASSGDPKHVEHYLDVLGARKFAEKWTTSADAENSKPAPDLVVTALRETPGGPALLVGDSTWDCKAAQNAGIPSVAVRTGGFSTEELTEAGAARVFDALTEINPVLEDLPFGQPDA